MMFLLCLVFTSLLMLSNKWRLPHHTDTVNSLRVLWFVYRTNQSTLKCPVTSLASCYIYVYSALFTISVKNNAFSSQKMAPAQEQNSFSLWSFLLFYSIYFPPTPSSIFNVPSCTAKLNGTLCLSWFNSIFWRHLYSMCPKWSRPSKLLQ